MKMSEVFTERVESFDSLLCLVVKEDLGSLNTVQIAEAAAHAINCHDELVEALELVANGDHYLMHSIRMKISAALKSAKG